jgi:hypothetical protein
MVKIGLVVITLALAACNSTTGSPSTASTPPDSSAPGVSGACIDRGELADDAESVMVTLNGIGTALAVPDLDQAGSLAATGSATMRAVADLAAPVRPDAAQGIRKAADELDTAKSLFPAGLSEFGQSRTDWQQGLLLAQTGECAA